MEFSALKIPHKEELRQVLLERFGRDIAEASCHFSSRNYAFVFSQGCFPAALRVSIGHDKSKADVISELMWVDDLRLSITTISQVVTSLRDRIVEEFDFGSTHYRATLFRKANGDVLPPTHWNDVYFRNAGRLLGQIHRTSVTEYDMGFRYNRCHWQNKPSFQLQALVGCVPDPVLGAAQSLLAKIQALPQEASYYNMIHGDYQMGNLFVDWDTVWDFDFDDCCYGFFMMDVGCCLHRWVTERSFRPEVSRENLLYGPGGILEIFRAGYEEFYTLPNSQWALLDDFLRLRTVESLVILEESQALPPDLMPIVKDALGSYLLAPGSFCHGIDENIRQVQRNFSTADLQNSGEKMLTQA